MSPADDPGRSQLSDSLESEIGGAFPGPIDSRSERAAGLALPAVAALEPGMLIGDFRLRSIIGEGGMGQVWEAEQLSLGGRAVAVKLVRPDRLTPRTLEFFQREARAGGRLSHPGIIAIHAYGETDGLAWLAMDLVNPGATLRTFIGDSASRGVVPDGYDREVARLVAEVADAMQAAHEAGVIHRDLKPQNVLLGSDGHPVVSDFGLARIVTEAAISQTGEFAGTYFYMSPEQVMGRRVDVDPRTDVFSLGTMLYEMLALRRPFLGDTSHQIVEQILESDPPDPRMARSRIPRDLVVIAGKALEKDPARRYSTMAELAADLRRFLRNEPIHARAPGQWQRAVKWVRRHPAKSAAGSVALVLFAAIAGLLLENVRARGIAEREATAVMRLSALQDLEDLISEAGELWPAHPVNLPAYEEWLRKANALVADLPVHEARRDELRGLALPQSEAEAQAERRADPEHARLVALQVELGFKRAELAQRRDGIQMELPEVDWGMYPDDAARLSAVALELVDIDRIELGNEGTGLLLALRALELATDEFRATAANTLSRACLALGRDEEALDAAYLSLEAAGEDELPAFEQYYQALEARIEELSSPEMYRRAEAEILELEEELELVEARIAGRQEWRFAPEHGNARWWNNQLTKLIRGLRGLRGLREDGNGLLGESWISPEHGWSIPRRLACARRMALEFAPGGEWYERWDAALPSIHAAYPGLELQVQAGLVPIGPDPASGLWEFWCVASGSEPIRAGADRELVVSEETGIVLVLLPGGTFYLGQSNARSSVPDFDSSISQGELRGGREAEMGPFFIGKYELTQAQWVRLTGRNQSYNSPSRRPTVIAETHPVETVSWFECGRALGWMGLELPTEAQWEYACRAGTRERFSCAESELSSHANLADETYGALINPEMRRESWDDGFAWHAPVGSLAPNGFGLHDMHGNVTEWCLDGPMDSHSQRALSAEEVVFLDLDRVSRGGGFSDIRMYARSSFRFARSPSFAVSNLGVRAARSIRP